MNQQGKDHSVSVIIASMIEKEPQNCTCDYGSKLQWRHNGRDGI